MFVTPDDLRVLDACSKGLKFLEENYPDGADTMTLVKDPNTPIEMLHWGREHLTHTPEELTEYCRACDIHDSTGYWYSDTVYDSQYVVKSHEVHNSRNIFYSNDVVDCADVSSSDDIQSSSQIFNSSMVNFCSYIYFGENIYKSVNVCHSIAVMCSNNINNSRDIAHSSEIIDCRDVSHSMFCIDCDSIKNCMFCNGISNAEYHIFNKPVDKERFELYAEQYRRYIDKLNFVENWPSDLTYRTQPIKIVRPDMWFRSVPAKFWRWARTLPRYTAEALYDMTFLPEILETEI